METQRKQMERTVRPEDGAGRFTTVNLPLPHEGVGNALRATFRPRRDDMPDDMLQLLARLDMH
jgi:hypothetical protein